MTSIEFAAACQGINKTLRELQAGEKETVSDEVCAEALIIVRNMEVGGTGDVLLCAAALNVLNTYVKQSSENRKTVGYFFKSSADFLAKYIMRHPAPELKAEIQQDQGMNLLLVDICSLQFSFHQVPISGEDLNYLAKDMENPKIRWDGIRKQHNAVTLFELVKKCDYQRSGRMMDGSSFEEGKQFLLEQFRNGKKSLSDLKKVYFGREEAPAAEDGARKHVKIPAVSSKDFPFRSKPSATLYESELRTFDSELLCRKLVDFLIVQYEEGYGYRVPELDGVEWKYLFETVFGLLRQAGADPETGLRIEYVRGINMEQMILILMSEGEGERIEISMTGLLSWEYMKPTEQPDIIQYEENRSEVLLEAIHPASYMSSFYRSFTGGIRDEGRFRIRPCVFFYDVSKTTETDICTGTGNAGDRAAVFYADEREALLDYIRPSISGKGGRRVLSRVRRELQKDGSRLGLAQDQVYLQQKLFREMNRNPKFLSVTDGRAKTGKSTLIGSVAAEMEKRGEKLFTVRNKADCARIPEDTKLVIYDDVIPESVSYSPVPFHAVFFDPLARTEEECADAAALKADAESRGVPVFQNTLTAAGGFSDLGRGNNWLIRHFALGIIQPQDWNPESYPITVEESPKDMKGGPGIARVVIPKKFRLGENENTVEYAEADRIWLYREFSKGSKGVQMVIGDERLRKKIKSELERSRNRYQWIESFVRDYQGDNGKLLEAQKEVFKNSTVRNKYESVLVEYLGRSAWVKLADDSRNWLLSAMLSFNDMRKYDQLLDFSGVVVQICKTLEAELCYRLVEEYERWLMAEYKDRFIDELPSVLSEVSDGRKKMSPVSRFTLGSMPYIMGLDSSGGVEDPKALEKFKKYASEHLFAEPKKDPEPVMRDMVRITEHVRVNYRNKAAHKDSMDIVIARECIDYCILKERKLGVIMDLFRF